mgnify:CR=1 FL=1
MDSRKKYVVAVDIGSSEVVIAVGTIVDGGAINIETVVAQPVVGVTAGLVDNSQTVAEALRAAREEASSDDFLFIGGSCFIVADLLQLLHQCEN